MLTQEPRGVINSLDHVPNILSEDDVKFLEDFLSLEEVRVVVFSIDEESTVDPDGFTRKLFTTAWDIIAEDVFKIVLEFFRGNELPRSIMAIYIVLIPKVFAPQEFS